ncbi:MAG: FAD:protein FMN transferase [Gammaproteobacteria bacterium]
MPAGRAFVVAAALALAGCRHAAPPPTVARAWEVMGGIFSVAAWGRDSAALARAADQALDSVRRVDSLLSIASEVSEVVTLNRRKEARRVSDVFAAVLGAALDVARRSHGAYDPTRRDWRGVTFDSALGAVALRRGVALDFGGIAEGYALDRALLPLRAVADSVLLSLGGQFLIMTPAVTTGAPRAGRRVGVPDPDNTLRVIAVIEIPSGTWSVRTLSPVDQPAPIMDPRTRQPAVRARSVTTVAREGMTAEVWSSAFFVLGCDSALVVAPQLDRTRVGVLCVDERVRWSADLDGRVFLTDSAMSAGTAPAPAPGRAPAAVAEPSGSTTREGPDSSR